MERQQLLQQVEEALENARHAVDKAHYFKSQGTAGALVNYDAALFEAEMELITAELYLD